MGEWALENGPPPLWGSHTRTHTDFLNSAPSSPCWYTGDFLSHLMLATGPRVLNPMLFGKDHACFCRWVVCRGVPGINNVIIGAVPAAVRKPLAACRGTATATATKLSTGPLQCTALPPGYQERSGHKAHAGRHWCCHQQAALHLSQGFGGRHRDVWTAPPSPPPCFLRVGYLAVCLGLVVVVVVCTDRVYRCVLRGQGDPRCSSNAQGRGVWCSVSDSGGGSGGLLCSPISAPSSSQRTVFDLWALTFEPLFQTPSPPSGGSNPPAPRQHNAVGPQGLFGGVTPLPQPEIPLQCLPGALKRPLTVL